MLKIVFVGLLCVISFYEGQSVLLNHNPGAKFRVSKSGIDLAINVAVKVMAQKVKEFKPENISMMFQMGKMKYEYSLSNMRISNINEPLASVEMDEGSGLTLKMEGASMSMEGDYKFAINIFPIEQEFVGSMILSIRNASLQIAFQFEKIIGTVMTKSCSASVEDISVKTNGNTYGLNTPALYGSQLKSLYEKTVCEMVSKQMSTYATLFLLRPNYIQLNNFLIMDFSLVNYPVFGPNFLESQHKANILQDTWSDTNTVIDVTTNKMIGVAFSESIMKSAFRVLHNVNYFIRTFKFSKAKELFGSDSQAFAFKELPLDVTVASVTSPTVSISQDGIFGNVHAVGNFSTTWSNSTQFTFLSIKFSVAFQIGATIDKDIIRGNVNADDPVITSTSIPLSTNSTNLVKISLKQLLEKVFSFFNFSKQLPTLTEVVYKNTSLILREGYIFVTTDLE